MKFSESSWSFVLFVEALALALVIRSTLTFWEPDVPFRTACQEALRAQPWATITLIVVPVLVGACWMFGIDP
jgi:hypothetical protein